jgi:hypothetical protein
MAMKQFKLLLAAILGLVLLTAQPARASGDDVAYGVAGAALLAWAVYAVSHNGGEFAEQLEQYGAEMAPWLIDTAATFLNDADTRTALGEEQADLAILALNYFAPRLANRHSELAGGAVPLSRLWDYGRREYPFECAMIYRETDVSGVMVAEGLWPRLEAWLRDRGYLGQATLYEELSSGGIHVELTDEDRDELVELAARAIVEEYYAVRVGQRIEVDLTVVPAGLDTEGE